MSKFYGIFDGEYSNWGTRGFFTTREEAEKYCCVHTDCYIIEMPDLGGKEELSDIRVYYEQEIVFDLESGLDSESTWARNEEMVDWIARQFPKMADCFKEAGILQKGGF